MKKTIILSLLLLVGGLLPTMADNVTVNGTSRSYNVIVPKNLGENRPLLIFCHGYNQDANWMQNSEFKNEKVSMEAVCDTAKFVCVFPNGIDKSWDTSGDRDINFIKAIIEKMVTQHKIDRNRVYLGGFSMGGMLTYHAMNRIPDLIAAFCPVSGYPMGGATAGTNVRPIPILHIHGTSDDVCAFSGAQPALNVWIRHNGCPTTAKVKSNYNGFNGAKMHTWGPGNDGVEVKLLELPNKGHWICKETQVYTGKEIWNFCKNYSLNKTSPNVSITSPKTGARYVSFAPAGQTAFPDFTITATADDSNGTIEKVEFYDGTTLLATCTAKPYQAINVGLQANLLDNRLGVNANFFIHSTKDLLALKSFENPIGGINNYWTNDGEVRNTGFEVGVNGKPVVMKDLQVEIGATVGHYKNEVKALANGDYTSSIYGSDNILTSVGNAVGVFYGYKTRGIFSTTADAQAAGLYMIDETGAKQYFAAGDVIFEDVNNDGMIDVADKQVIGDPNPDFYGNIFLNLSWKRFTLGTTFNYSLGNDVYNYQRAILNSGSTLYNQQVAEVGHWRYEGQKADLPRVNYGDPMGNNRFSDRWIEDGSYMRLKSVMLSYQIPIPESWQSWLQGVSVWAEGRNLFTLTKYKGSDPEFSASNNQLYQGIDCGNVAQGRIFSMGVKINL